MGNELVQVLSHNGVSISADADGYVSLTDLWKSSGEDRAKSPQFFLRNAHAVEFIESLAENLKAQKCALTKVLRGKTLGGTWAHWQIAMAYAKWLSPEFHQAVNEGFRRWYEEEKNPSLKIERGVDKFLKRGVMAEWVKRRFDGIVTRKMLTGTMKDHNCTQRQTYAMATNSINLAAIGKTATEFKSGNGLARNDNPRDHMSERELIRIQFAESEATSMIREEAADGDQECLDCVKVACNAVRSVIKAIDVRAKQQAATQ